MGPIGIIFHATVETIAFVHPFIKRQQSHLGSEDEETDGTNETTAGAFAVRARFTSLRWSSARVLAFMSDEKQLYPALNAEMKLSVRFFSHLARARTMVRPGIIDLNFSLNSFHQLRSHLSLLFYRSFGRPCASISSARHERHCMKCRFISCGIW